MADDPLPRLSKRAFLFVVPTLRVEAACAVTVVALFAATTAEDSFFVEFVEVLRDGWREGEYAMCVFFPLLALAMAIGLLLPWVALFVRSHFTRRLRVLTVLASAFVIVAVLGWSAAEHLGASRSDTWVHTILAIIAFAELAFVGFGVFQLLDDRELMRTFLGAGRPDFMLFAVIMCAVAALLALHLVGELIGPATAALFALNAGFVVASLWRKPGQATWIEE
jgi:hypothetical protein